MGVNSALTGFFTNHRVVSSCIVIMMPMIFFIASSFTQHPDRELRTKDVNVIIRQIGHRLLLQAGDSTSRVLPVTESKEGTFLLQFENEFIFNSDSLVALSKDLLPKTQFPSGYTVTVHDCRNADIIIYGFQVNNTLPDVLPCMGRRQPTGCYMVEFAFLDFYENAEHKKPDIDRPTEQHKSLTAESQKASPKLEVSNTTTFDHDINPQREEPTSVKMDSRETNQKLEEFKTTTFDLPLIDLVSIAVLVLGVTFLIVHSKKLIPVSAHTQDHGIIKTPVPEFIALGKFLFDVKGQRLVLGSEVISLTDKECRILELLNKSFSELLPRETLIQKIWIDEGVITGRSLDMFVSKLRKKLSSDPELKITNVHGKGYRLEMQII